MTIAATVKKYLNDRGVDYELVDHPHSQSSMETAEAAHVSGERLAKAVVLKDADGYLVAVMPATRKLSLAELHEMTGRRFAMAAEEDLGELFRDCDVGAVPALAGAYGLKAVCDESLAGPADVFFEGGDHRSVVRVTGDDFQRLMAEAEHGAISHHL